MALSLCESGVQPQSFFEIPEHAISLSSWQLAIDEMNTIDQQLLPSLKLRALVSAVHKVRGAPGAMPDSPLR